MAEADLRADCANCAALCCVALAFDKGPKFAFAKAAGQPCRHLTGENGCAIHAERAARGFEGCIAYDCLGAGQRVAAMFGGRRWRDDEAALRSMLEAFATVRRAHEQIELLRAAGKLALTEADRQVRDNLERRLWDASALDSLDQLIARSRAFLTSLGGYVGAKAEGPWPPGSQ